MKGTKEIRTLSGKRRLSAEDITFDGDMEFNDDMDRLQFYIGVWFNPDEVFGTNVNTFENDDYVNVYVDYDVDHGTVADYLDVVIWIGDEPVHAVYPLNGEEAFILKAMEDYCFKLTGMPLDVFCAQAVAKDIGVSKTFPIITKPAQRIYEKQAAEDCTPDICGYFGRACSQMNKSEGANRMLCDGCPLAIMAKRINDKEEKNDKN